MVLLYYGRLNFLQTEHSTTDIEVINYLLASRGLVIVGDQLIDRITGFTLCCSLNLLCCKRQSNSRLYYRATC